MAGPVPCGRDFPGGSVIAILFSLSILQLDSKMERPTNEDNGHTRDNDCVMSVRTGLQTFGWPANGGLLRLARGPVSTTFCPDDLSPLGYRP
jgi:hypothetical protein